MKHATSFGGPYIFLPSSLVPQWVESLGELPDPTEGLYGEVCGGDNDVDCLNFENTEVLRIAIEPTEVFWLPNSNSGGLFIQWVAADSIEQLVEYARSIEQSNDWDKELSFNASTTSWKLMDSCGFEGDGQPKVDVELSTGTYKVSTAYRESESVWALVVSLTKLGEQFASS